MVKLKDLIIIENSFDGAPGGSSTLGYGQQYGTIGGGNYTQNPTKFSSSDKTTNNFAPNTNSGSALIGPPDRPDRVNSKNVSKNVISPEKQTKNVVSPAANADIQQSQKPLDPSKQYGPQVDQIFKKKDTPSPDELLTSLQYEMSQMVKKDKAIAKQIVLKNLKHDPHYYSSLQMLNIDDENMVIPESNKKQNMKETYNSRLTDKSTFEKTKKVLDDMIAEKQKGRVIENSSEITKIFQDLSDKRKSLRKLSLG